MMLSIRDLTARHGAMEVLFGVDLDVAEGGTLALIGSNGAGKSTTFGVMCGLLRATAGKVELAGRSILGKGTRSIVIDGLVMVPEGRHLFPSLTAEENLLIGGHAGRRGPWSLKRVYDVFPTLVEFRNRPSARLSGGQQQLVAIGRALMANPVLMICDELSLGLSPPVVAAVYSGLGRIRREGVASILVEQDITRALRESDTFACMRHGRIVLTGASSTADRSAISDAYFGAKSHG